MEKLRQNLHEIKTELNAKASGHHLAEIMADKEMAPQLLTALNEILEKSKQSDET